MPEAVGVWPAATMFPDESTVTALNCPLSTWLMVADGLLLVMVAGSEINAVVEPACAVAMVAPAGIPGPQMVAPASAELKVVAPVKVTVVDPLVIEKVAWREVRARRSAVNTGSPAGVYPTTTGTGPAPPHD